MVNMLSSLTNLQSQIGCQHAPDCRCSTQPGRLWRPTPPLRRAKHMHLAGHTHTLLTPSAHHPSSGPRCVLLLQFLSHLTSSFRTLFSPPFIPRCPVAACPSVAALALLSRISQQDLIQLGILAASVACTAILLPPQRPWSFSPSLESRSWRASASPPYARCIPARELPVTSARMAKRAHYRADIRCAHIVRPTRFRLTHRRAHHPPCTAPTIEQGPRLPHPPRRLSEARTFRRPRPCPTHRKDSVLLQPSARASSAIAGCWPGTHTVLVSPEHPPTTRPVTLRRNLHHELQAHLRELLMSVASRAFPVPGRTEPGVPETRSLARSEI